MTEILTGGCLCGAVRYRAEAKKTLHYLCHCTDCQRYGGAPYHVGVVVAADDLEVTGEMRHWAKTADSGRTVARHFCGSCGGHLMTSPWPDPHRFSLKAGSLDDPSLYRPRHEIWARSRLEWADLPDDLECFEQGFLGPVPIG